MLVSDFLGPSVPSEFRPTCRGCHAFHALPRHNFCLAPRSDRRRWGVLYGLLELLGFLRFTEFLGFPSCHAAPLHALAGVVGSSCRLFELLGFSGFLRPCHAMPRHASLCRAMSRHAMASFRLSALTVGGPFELLGSCSTSDFRPGRHSMPCYSMPCLAMPRSGPAPSWVAASAFSDTLGFSAP